MTKFFDPLSGEPRELNYHGIKCRREPEPVYVIEIGGPPIEAVSWSAPNPDDPDDAYDNMPYFPGTFGTAYKHFETRRRDLLNTVGDIWAKPANRTHGLPELLHGFDISSNDTVHIGFNAPAVPIPGYTPPKLTDPDVTAYGWRHGIFYVQLKAGMHSFTEPFFNLYYEDEETAYNPFAAVAR